MDQPTNRVDVATAAARLGITTEAVYKRIRRGQLPANRLDGRWFVQLDGLDHRNRRPHQPAEPPDEPPSTGSSSSSSALVAVLEAEVAFLRGQVEALHERLREAHLVQAQLAARPLLEAPCETRTDPQSAQPPWWSWRRWLVWP